jgi:hypothetical protein
MVFQNYLELVPSKPKIDFADEVKLAIDEVDVLCFFALKSS